MFRLGASRIARNVALTQQVNAAAVVIPQRNLSWIPTNPWRVDPEPPVLNKATAEAYKAKAADDWSKLSGEDRQLLYRLSYGKTIKEHMAGSTFTGAEYRFIGAWTIGGLIFSYVLMTSLTKATTHKKSVGATPEWIAAQEKYLRAHHAEPMTLGYKKE